MESPRCDRPSRDALEGNREPPGRDRPPRRRLTVPRARMEKKPALKTLKERRQARKAKT
jgi:hypothetical protein